MLIDQCIASFATPPRHLLFDLDAVDDPTHGQQQLTLFHGFYEQYQYLPLLISWADNDQIVLACLRHGTAHAALGADDDLEYLVQRLRAVWPWIQIEVRGDAGFGMPWMYEVGERLGLTYTCGLAAMRCSRRGAPRCWPRPRPTTPRGGSRSACLTNSCIRRSVRRPTQ